MRIFSFLVLLCVVLKISLVPNYLQTGNVSLEQKNELKVLTFVSDDISIIMAKNIIESKKVQTSKNCFQHKSVRSVQVENKLNVEPTIEYPQKRVLFLSPFFYQSSYL